MAFVSRLVCSSFPKHTYTRINVGLKFILPLRHDVNRVGSLRVRLFHNTAQLANKAKPKIQVKEFRRLLGIAKPEKYKLAGVSEITVVV
jgi:hypothetical protein